MISFNLRGVYITCLLQFICFSYLWAQYDQEPPCGCNSGAIVEVNGQILFEAEVEDEFEPDFNSGTYWDEFVDGSDTYYAFVDENDQLEEDSLHAPADTASYGNICYAIKIESSGIYRFQMRSTIDKRAADNSVWVRFRGDHQIYRGVEDNPATPIEEFSNETGWFVAFRTDSASNWLWLTRTGALRPGFSENKYGGEQVSGFHRNIYVEFKSAGYYALELSAREEGFGIDKFFMYRVDTTVATGGEITVNDDTFEDSEIDVLNSSSREPTLSAPINNTEGDNTLCKDVEAFSLMATASGGTQGYTYQWKSNFANNLGTASVYEEDSLDVETVFTVNVTDLYGCQESGNITLELNPQLAANAGMDIAFCNDQIGEAFTLGGMPTGIGGSPFLGPEYNYRWSPLENFMDPADTSQANPSILIPDTETTFTVIIKDSQNCEDTSQIKIEVFPTPSLDPGNLQSNYFIFNEEELRVPLSGSPEEAMFRWEIIDTDNLLKILEPDSGSQIMQSFQLLDSTRAGMATYRIFPFLNGCEGEPFDISIEIWLRPGAPALLTPNGDGMNDEWKPNAPEEGFSVQVFSRRGAVVFQSDNPDMPWDGGNSPDGIYWYVMKTLLGEFKGALLLQRSIRR